MSKKTPEQLRSRRWFGGGPGSTEHTSHALQAGYSREEFEGRPVIGIIKEVLGFRQFSLRGLTAAAGEWCLVCLAWNLKRLHVLMSD